MACFEERRDRESEIDNENVCKWKETMRKTEKKGLDVIESNMKGLVSVENTEDQVKWKLRLTTNNWERRQRERTSKIRHRRS